MEKFRLHRADSKGDELERKRKKVADVIPIHPLIEENDCESFLFAFSQICCRRNAKPFWEKSTYYHNDDGYRKDLLLDDIVGNYDTIKQYALKLWNNGDECPEMEIRNGFAEFLYNSLDPFFSETIKTILKPENIHRDGPMVWLTIRNELFASTTVKESLMKIQIEDEDHLNYTLKIKNGLSISPELKNDAEVIGAFYNQLQTYNGLPIIKPLDVISDNPIGQFDEHNGNVLFHQALEWSEREKYPEDCYSFLSIGKSYTGKILGLTVWSFQITLLLFMVLSVTVKNLRSDGEVDNPDSNIEGKSGLSYWMAHFIPSNASGIVRGAQLVSILAFLFFADFSLKDIVRSIETLPLLDFGWFITLISSITILSLSVGVVYGVLNVYGVLGENEEYINFDNTMNIVKTATIALVFFVGIFLITKFFDRFAKLASPKRRNEIEFTTWMVASSYLRLLQGLLASFTVILLVMTSANVVDIVLIFTALNFISELDDKAFILAKKGQFGAKLKKEANVIEHTPLPSYTVGVGTSNYGHLFFWVIISTIGVCIFAFVFFIIDYQSDIKIWSTETYRVQFGEETGLQSYNGCYNFSNAVYYKRKIYDIDTSSTEDARGKFGYCKKDRQWLFFNEEPDSSILDPCLANNAKLAYSSKTDLFDISASFDESWYSAFGTPIDMFFVSFGSNLGNDCESFNDGICDSSLNILTYQYDGGDCCAATCTNDNCLMRNTFHNPFGVEGRTGKGFPECIDRDMVAITIRLDKISIPSNESNLLINCDGVDILSVEIDEEMENEIEKIMVKDGNCTMTVTGNTTQFVSDWYVGFTVFHGDRNFMNDGVVMVEGQFNNITNNINFKRIPDCYFNKLGDEDLILYPVNKTIYTDNKRALEGVYSLMEDGKYYDTYCHDDLLLNKYELACNKTFLNDGYCDLYFNSAEFEYDGGDCCGATCQKSSCGIDALKVPFGNNDTIGLGFPHCIDPTMFPVTIKMEKVTIDFNLKLICDELNMLNINVDPSMENKTETVMTSDAAKCTLLLTNAASSEPNWAAKQVILIVHGDSTSINENPIVIHKSKSNDFKSKSNDFIQEQGYSFDFQRISECFFNPEYDLEGFDSSNMYKNSDPSYKAIKSMMYEGIATCDDENFIYKYNKALFNSNCSTITDIICDDENYENLSTLCMLASSFDDLFSKLADEKMYWTVFAPTNRAFEKFVDAKLRGYSLELMEADKLNQLLRFFLVYGNEINREDFICSDPIITMFNGKDSRTQCRDGNIPFGQSGRANDASNVLPKFTTENNIKACNGAIHPLDQVLLHEEPDVDTWLRPTAQPSQSALPSRSPSIAPTHILTSSPTVSPKPTSSANPTNKPSNSVITSIPTYRPTSAPSFAPLFIFPDISETEPPIPLPTMSSSQPTLPANIRKKP